MLTVIGHSRALFSTWISVPELSLLLDVGEGVNETMAGRLGAVDTIAISHGHTDHFTGLMNAIITRRRLGGNTMATGQPRPPMRVIFPAGDGALSEHIDYLTRYFRRIGFGVGPEPGNAAEFIGIAAGETVPLPGGGRTPRQIRSFAVDHTRDVVSLGFLVEEERRKLRPELAELPGPELAKLAAEHGRDWLSAPVVHKLLCYSGDTRPMKNLPAAGADILLHEATFAAREDVDTDKHSVLPEVLDLCASLDPTPSRLVLCHISTRYARGEFGARLKRLLGERTQAGQPLNVPVSILDEL
jgi:ribonuclease Z